MLIFLQAKNFTGNIDLKLNYHVGGTGTGSITIHHLYNLLRLIKFKSIQVVF